MALSGTRCFVHPQGLAAPSRQRSDFCVMSLNCREKGSRAKCQASGWVTPSGRMEPALSVRRGIACVQIWKKRSFWLADTTCLQLIAEEREGEYSVCVCVDRWTDTHTLWTGCCFSKHANSWNASLEFRMYLAWANALFILNPGWGPA